MFQPQSKCAVHTQLCCNTPPSLTENEAQTTGVVEQVKLLGTFSVHTVILNF